MTKYLIFKVKNQMLGIKSNQLVNIVKNVKVQQEEEKPLSTIEIWGTSIPIINLHQLLFQQNLTEKANVLLVEVGTEEKKKDVLGITFDEITELTILDDLLSYPFQFQPSSHKSYKEVVVNYKGTPLTILNIPHLRKLSQGSHIFPTIYLAN